MYDWDDDPLEPNVPIIEGPGEGFHIDEGGDEGGNEEMSPERFAEMLFNAYYPIPHIQYYDSMMSEISAEGKQYWQQFLTASQTLREFGILTVIVPLSYDAGKNVWWVDYANDFVRHFKLNPDNLPIIIVELRIDEARKFMNNQAIYCYHDKIDGVFKDKVIQEMYDKYKWFDWDKTEDGLMYLMMEEY